jgi:hypothetical protein
MDIAARHGDPRTLYAEVFEEPSLLLANTMGLGLSILLHPVLSTVTVGKLMVSFYAVGVPLGFVALALAFGRSPWLAFFTLPMVFNGILSVGFLNYLFGLPVLFGSLALARAFAEGGGAKRGIGLALLLAACYFAHMIVFLIALGMAVALIALFVNRRADLSRFAVLIPSLPLLIGWVARMFGSGTWALSSGGKGLGLVFKDLDARLAQMHLWGMQFFRSPVDERVFALLAGCWLILLLLGCRRSSSIETAAIEPSPWYRRHALEGITICCAIAYFVLPSHMRQMNVITERLVILFLFLLTLWPRVGFERAAQLALALPLVVVALGYPFYVKAEFQRFERVEVGELPRMIASLPDRSRLAYLRFPRSNSVTYAGPLWYLPRALHATSNGGISSASFAERHYTPVQYRNGAPLRRVGRRLNDKRQQRILLQHDYLLIRKHGKPRVALRHPRLSLLDHDRSWWLFRVRGTADGG